MYVKVIHWTNLTHVLSYLYMNKPEYTQPQPESQDEFEEILKTGQLLKEQADFVKDELNKLLTK